MPVQPLPGWLTRRAYAHRGSHGGAVPENSMAAFDRAMAAGEGIECDVRAAGDGAIHVFHDARLERMTGVAGRFDGLDSADVAALCLKDGSRIPTLSAMLGRVAGRVPILVEVKTGRRFRHRLCRAVACALDGYTGPVAVMSFDPRISAWFAQSRRRTLRGLVLSGRGHPSFSVRRHHALAIARARPHFIACDVRDLGVWPISREKTKLCWTVRSNSDRVRAHRYGLQSIYEPRRVLHG